MHCAYHNQICLDSRVCHLLSLYYKISHQNRFKPNNANNDTQKKYKSSRVTVVIVELSKSVWDNNIHHKPNQKFNRLQLKQLSLYFKYFVCFSFKLHLCSNALQCAHQYGIYLSKHALCLPVVLKVQVINHKQSNQTSCTCTLVLIASLGVQGQLPGAKIVKL